MIFRTRRKKNIKNPQTSTLRTLNELSQRYKSTHSSASPARDTDFLGLERCTACEGESIFNKEHTDKLVYHSNSVELGKRRQQPATCNWTHVTREIAQTHGAITRRTWTQPRFELFKLRFGFESRFEWRLRESLRRRSDELMLECSIARELAAG